MKQLFYILFFLAICPRFACASEGAKLPYAAGERFIVTTGYDTPPTHVKKDSYAIDLAQDGCGAYGKPAVAALSGTVWIAEENGYNGGYGTQLLILARDGIVTRYAHLIPGSIPINQGDTVSQGTIVGEIGDTGLVAGTACREHPGTHIHFAMDTKNADGSFAAKDPEPISGYDGITAGKWYVSDNVLAATKSNLASLLEILENLLGSGMTAANPSNLKMITTTSISGSAPIQASSSGSPQLLPTISVAPSGSNSDVVQSPSSATGPTEKSLPQNVASTGSVSAAITTPSIVGAPSGGGSMPVGGVSASAPLVPIMAMTSSVLMNDPLDDSVFVCE